MELTWFGKQYDSPVYHDCKQVPAPVDSQCLYCDEDILPEEDGFIDGAGSPFHRECWLRILVGSVAHQRMLCGCYQHASIAVSEESEGFLSRREAAKAAVAYHEGPFGGRHRMGAN
jgi:hypothetical protein